MTSSQPRAASRLPPAPVADQRLLRFLKQTGRIDPSTAASIDEAVAEGRVSAVDALVDSGTFTDQEVARAIAEALKLPLVDLRSTPPHDDAAGLVSRSTAEHYGLVPLSVTKDALVVAMANAFDQEALQYVETASGAKLEPVVAPGSQILEAIEHLYQHEASLGLLLADVASSRMGARGSRSAPADELAPADVQAAVPEGERTPIVKMVNLILFEAFKAHASDVHVEPGPNLVLVRFRIDGILEEHMQMPRWVHGPIAARLKAMAKLDLSERRLPQEGRLAVRVRDASIHVRVSTMPTTYGEKVVLRSLDPATQPRRLTELGLSPRDLARIESAIGHREGVILCAGPTGSGTTTTLHAILQELADPERDVVAIERGVEPPVAGVTAIAVDEARGLTFAEALRSALDQDSDVVLVGEMRDRDTAQTVFRAARSGRLVLSAVHARDGVAALARVLELGVGPEAIAASLLAVVAERLVRAVCSVCAEAAVASEEACQAVGLPAGRSIRRGRGCAACRHTGYAGRTGCFEVLRMTRRLARALEADAAEAELRAAVADEGESTLLDDARAKVLAGTTTPSEVLRAIELDSRAPACPTCHAPIETSFTVCPYCRSPLHLVCSRCGAVLKKRWSTCPFCGASAAAPGRGEVVAGTPPGSGPGLGVVDVPRILAVDDDPDVLELLRLTLTRSVPTLHAEVASSGADALDKVREIRPHLVVLDLMMPGIDGYEVCRRLRGDLSTALIPIIMLTALSDADSKRLGFLAGTDDYLVKPFERAELLARIHRLLQRTYGWAGSDAAGAGADRVRHLGA